MQVDQGCPLSPLLYQYYNAALLEVTQEGNGEITTGFLDNIAYAAEDKTFEETNAKIRDMMTRTDGANAWAMSHHLEIEIDKLKGIGLT